MPQRPKTAGEILAKSLRNKTKLDPNELQAAFQRQIPGASHLVHVEGTNQDDAPKTTEKKPDLILTFPLGDYSHAIQCYERAKQWVVETGQAYREDLYGQILRPEHPQGPQEERFVPIELTNDPNWTVRVLLVASTPEVLKWLLTLPTPEGTTLTVT